MCVYVCNSKPYKEPDIYHVCIASGAGGGKGGQNTESVPAAAAIDIEDQGEGGDDEDDFIVASYAAWKTFPVRVNGLPMDVTAKDVEKAFAKVSLRCLYTVTTPHD